MIQSKQSSSNLRKMMISLRLKRFFNGNHWCLLFVDYYAKLASRVKSKKNSMINCDIITIDHNIRIQLIYLNITYKFMRNHELIITYEMLVNFRPMLVANILDKYRDHSVCAGCFAQIGTLKFCNHCYQADCQNALIDRLVGLV